MSSTGSTSPNVDQADVDQLIKVSVEAGINFIDTADVLHRRPERGPSLGRSLKTLNIPRKDIIIAQQGPMVAPAPGPQTDVGASPQAHPWTP